jgi:hypothetical protein
MSYSASEPTVPQVSTKLVQPERLVTQSGATAGAGSGEFHVYRAQRRREMERLKKMDKEHKQVRNDPVKHHVPSPFSFLFPMPSYYRSLLAERREQAVPGPALVETAAGRSKSGQESKQATKEKGKDRSRQVVQYSGQAVCERWLVYGKLPSSAAVCCMHTDLN